MSPAQGFLTGVLQADARCRGIPIDSLSFSFAIEDDDKPGALCTAEEGAPSSSAVPSALETPVSHDPSTAGAAPATASAASTTAVGVLIDGLFLCGARYNRQTRLLEESLPKLLVEQLPAIRLKPEPDYKRNAADYECPLYKTWARAGTLTTTGASSNFVLALDVPTDQPVDKWVRMGVAALCAPDS